MYIVCTYINFIRQNKQTHIKKRKKGMRKWREAKTTRKFVRRENIMNVSSLRAKHRNLSFVTWHTISGNKACTQIRLMVENPITCCTTSIPFLRTLGSSVWFYRLAHDMNDGTYIHINHIRILCRVGYSFLHLQSDSTIHAQYIMCIHIIYYRTTNLTKEQTKLGNA